MAKGRSTYTFKVKDIDSAKKTVEDWLKQNKFKPQNLKGEEVYVSKSLWTGNKFFNCSFDGNTVTVEAFTHGIAGDFDLDTETGQTVAKPYKKLLNSLFSSLKELSE